jgi:uncharacterized membrane protein YphA (DoxX/SURF4 family)
MTTSGKGWSIAVWVLSGLLACAFIAAGGFKLAGAQAMVEHFRTWGYPDWFLFVVGAVEVTGAVLLLVPRAAFVGAGMLEVIMVGAIVTHLRHDPPSQALPALVLLLLLVLVGYARRPRMWWKTGA